MNRFLIGAFVAGTSLLLAVRAQGDACKPVAEWPLTEDARDHSGNERHAVNHGVAFGAKAPDGSCAARFDGRSAFLEVPASLAPSFKKDDFSISVEVWIEEALDDAPGDILGWFDPESRRGINLGVASFSGVGNSQPNYRNVHFGMDNGQLESAWSDCGRPGEAIFIFGFAVHEGTLYAATCEAREGASGHVYRYEGGDRWTDCGNPDPSNAIGALAVYDGHLYAGASRYDTTGSAMAASPNTAPGGKVYRHEGGSRWTCCGALANPETGQAATIGGLCVFKGALYATTLKQDGFGLYRYAGGTRWDYCGNPDRRVLNPCAFNGALYMVSYDGPGGPFRYDGHSFAYIGGSLQPPINQDYSFAVYDGALHVST